MPFYSPYSTKIPKNASPEAALPEDTPGGPPIPAVFNPKVLALPGTVNTDAVEPPAIFWLGVKVKVFVNVPSVPNGETKAFVGAKGAKLIVAAGF